MSDGEHAAGAHASEARYLCACGMTTPTMDAFVDHVTDEHAVLDVAAQALLEGELEVTADV